MCSHTAVRHELSTAAARSLIQLACRAPSVYNTQPWAWRIRPGGVALYADHERRLAATDPAGRNLLISCGTALHHLQVAARAVGLAPTVRRLPDPAAPALLAELEFAPGPVPPGAAAELTALRGSMHRPPALYRLAGAR